MELLAIDTIVRYRNSVYRVDAVLTENMYRLENCNIHRGSYIVYARRSELTVIGGVLKPKGWERIEKVS